jgi:secondary thiamine-phosphate synthase enzyme
MHDLTENVQKIIGESRIITGMVGVSVIGSTAGISTIEFEPGFERDLPELLARLIPPGRNYGHEQAWHDGNGHSHLQATLLGPSLTLPISDGRLVVGTWQQVFLIELDVKPRQREVVVTVYGE